MVEVMKIMATSFKRSHACTTTLSAPTLQQATADPRLCRRLQRKHGLGWSAQGSGALSVAVPAWDILKEVTIILITSTIVWLQVKQQGGNTAQKIVLKIY